MRILLLLLTSFSSYIFADDLTLICEGSREFRGFDDKKINVVEYESVLLKIKENSMEYIGINSGRRYLFSNKEFSSPKRPPHEDISISVNYKLSPNAINASHKIVDSGFSKDSSISQFNLDVDLIQNKLEETESIVNKSSLKKQTTFKFKATCKKEDRTF